MKCNVPGCERDAVKDAESGKCTLHAPLGEKDSEKFWTEFEEHFEKAEAEVKAGDLEAVLNCTGFVFPDTGTKFKSRVFEMKVLFENAEFVKADFAGIEFKQPVDFSKALFKDKAEFKDSTFSRRALFNTTKFERDALFGKVEFGAFVSFYATEFKRFTFFSHSKFHGEATFKYSRFAQNKNESTLFADVIFEGDADFSETTFYGQLNFRNSRFKLNCHFKKSVFSDDVDFEKANLGVDADFSGAAFGGRGIFCYAEFEGSAAFSNATFEGFADFEHANFAGTTIGEREQREIISFWNVKFKSGADFVSTLFLGPTTFQNTEFAGKANFSGSTFHDVAHFYNVTFGQETFFAYTAFLEGAAFRYSRFFDVTYFLGVSGEPGINKSIIPAGTEIEFSRVYVFGRNTRVIFDKVNLRDWSFSRTAGIGDHNSAVFEDVIWEKSGDKRKKTKDDDIACRTKRRLDFEAAAEVYRRLRKNYEDRLAYAEAGDFHIGEMEMMLAGNLFGKPKLYFLKWYKRLSNFGESVGWPLVWFIGLWATFFAIWLILPARHEFAGIVNTLKGNFYSPWEWLSKTRLPDITEFGWYIWDKFWFTVKTFFTFPRPEGSNFEQAVGAGQRFLGVTIIAFFILALRRAFRR